MNKTYSLSIVIPTKNRQFYCIKAIEQVLENTSPSVQLVIQDNSSDPSILSSYISSLKCDRITYNHQSKVLSFVDNFSEAISLALGDYVCMIGDDDGVLSSIEYATQFAKKNDVDCFVPSQNAVYIWPSSKPIVRKAEGGYLCLSYLSKKICQVEVIDSLKALLHQGFQNYQRLKVPRLYHGIVKRSILESINNRTGHYFGGLTPDMYMVVALCIACKNVVFYGMPITISGICPQSGSSASATGKHTGNISDAPHLVGHINYDWSEMVPKIYTVETIWADTGIHALYELGKEEYIKEFNCKSLTTSLSFKYPQFKEEFDNFQKNHFKITVFDKISYRFNKFFSYLEKGIKRVFRGKKTVQKYYNVADIKSATSIVDMSCPLMEWDRTDIFKKHKCIKS